MQVCNNFRGLKMKTAKLTIVQNKLMEKPMDGRGKVSNFKTDKRLKANRKKKRAYIVRQHVRARKEHSEATVFLFVRAPTDQLKTTKSMLHALGCTHRIIEI